MKKIITAIILILFVVFLPIFCTKPDLIEKDNVLNVNNFFKLFPDTSNLYNYVFINSNQMVDGHDSTVTIDAICAFIDSATHKVVKIKQLVVNGRGVTRNQDNTYHLKYIDSYYSEGRSLVGKNVTIKLKGTSDADTVTTKIYLPKDMLSFSQDFPTNDFPHGTISKSHDLTIRWIPDNKTDGNNVFIEIYYYKDISYAHDSTLTQNVSTKTYLVANNGSYTISSADFSTFPVNSYVGFSFGRGSKEVAILPVSHKKVFYFAITSANSSPTLVQN